jgi:hypothetical protein
MASDGQSLLAVAMASCHQISRAPCQATWPPVRLSNDLLDAGLGVGKGVVDVLLEGHGTAAAQSFIGGDDDGGAGVYDATGQGLGRETAKDDGVNCADTGTGQHGHGRFRHHGHVETGHIAAFDPLGFEHVGKLAHFTMQLAIGQLAILGRIVPFPDDGDFVATLGQVPVQAVGGDVELAIFEPFDGDVTGIVGAVLDLGVGGHPVEDLALFSPEGVWILHRGLIHGLIASLVQQGVLADVGFDRVDLVLAHCSLL